MPRPTVQPWQLPIATATAIGGVKSGNASVLIGTDGTLTSAVLPQTPASASAAGTANTITYDSGFIYVCVATNTWKRVAIATW